MIGAVFGDMIGSVYEWHNVKREDFLLFSSESRFTDDTVMTIAVADKMLHKNLKERHRPSERENYAMWYKQYVKRYPDAGFGQMFEKWAKTPKLYIQRSYGNGAAMRVSPIAYLSEDLKIVLKGVKESCYYTHHNKEAITGAKAVASAIFFARKGMEKKEIRLYIERKYHYVLTTPLDELRKNYIFNSRTRYCVEPAIIAFLESDSYESAIRKAISIGGDSDTIACITGGIAQAYYREIPKNIYLECMNRLDSGLRSILLQFCKEYRVI